MSTQSSARTVRAVLFDLDGVLTDTAEYHYLAWKRLADDLGIPFTRADGDRLRGVSRRPALEIILDLGGRTASEQEIEEWMVRKNTHYQELITSVTSADLLPGVAELLRGLKERGIRIAVASASKNSPEVISRLGIEDSIDKLIHGGMVERQKPHPDLFLHAAAQVGVEPAECIVVEDAAAGVQAAISAGMISVGLGPRERVGMADRVFGSLEGVTVDALLGLSE
jgi:kojibiose phosphorylase